MKKLRINSSTHGFEAINSGSFLGNFCTLNELGNQGNKKRICYIIFFSFLGIVIFLILLVSFSYLMNLKKSSNSLNSVQASTIDKVTCML